jgi:hypothetical protein
MRFCRLAIPVAVAAAGLLLTALGPSGGCGPAAREIDSAGQYTPESLAAELAFRYRALTPEAKKAPSRNRTASKTNRSIAQLESAEKLQTKGKAAATEKKGRALTLDDLLDEFEGKLDLIKGMSRLDACRQASEAISRDSSLSESEKKLLSEKLKELGAASS